MVKSCWIKKNDLPSLNNIVVGSSSPTLSHSALSSKEASEKSRPSSTDGSYSVASPSKQLRRRGVCRTMVLRLPRYLLSGSPSTRDSSLVVRRTCRHMGCVSLQGSSRFTRWVPQGLHMLTKA